MSVSFDKLFLMSGKDFKVSEYITLHHPIIEDIITLNNGYQSELIYWGYVNTLMSDPYTNMVMLDDIGLNYMKVSPFEVFIINWKNASEAEKKQGKDNDKAASLSVITSSIEFFTNEKYNFQLGQYENGEYCLYDTSNNNVQINRPIYEIMHEWVKSINCVDNSNRINPADENARRILIEDTRDEIKKLKRRKKKKSDNDGDYIGQLMTALSLCGNGSITPFNINNCKIYWLFEAYRLMQNKSRSDHLLDGIYHGTIKSESINKKELDWIK